MFFVFMFLVFSYYSEQDFTKWLAPLDLKITGLAATGGQLDVNHSWKVVQRGLLGQITGFSDDVIETTHASHRTLDPHHRDAILLLKESISSSASCACAKCTTSRSLGNIATQCPLGASLEGVQENSRLR